MFGRSLRREEDQFPLLYVVCMTESSLEKSKLNANMFQPKLADPVLAAVNFPHVVNLRPRPRPWSASLAPTYPLTRVIPPK